jgi:hypothetical protein
MPKVNPDKLTSVTIDVNEKLVKRGNVNNYLKCPIALAFKAVVHKKVDVEVMADTITLSQDAEGDENDTLVLDTPARAAKFIEKMDANDGIWREDQVRPKPFTFKVKIPNRFLRPSLRA